MRDQRRAKLLREKIRQILLYAAVEISMLVSVYYRCVYSPSDLMHAPIIISDIVVIYIFEYRVLTSIDEYVKAKEFICFLTKIAGDS